MCADSITFAASAGVTPARYIALGFVNNRARARKKFPHRSSYVPRGRESEFDLAESEKSQNSQSARRAIFTRACLSSILFSVSPIMKSIDHRFPEFPPPPRRGEERGPGLSQLPANRSRYLPPNPMLVISAVVRRPFPLNRVHARYVVAGHASSVISVANRACSAQKSAASTVHLSVCPSVI